ncbi:MAG: uracil phosphoribosyltransferase [Thermoleophilia bacterium]|nr:uracil phosphoribosyltransferase [Thermoleophilia bacterium]MDH3725587.1 uracil phosphoribosyltransferase [Thermoleophilia bacterium]
MPTVLDHPLAAHNLTILRDRTTSSPDFRQAARRLAHLLVAEATCDMSLEDVEIETPLEATTGKRLAKPVVLVSVLRAGLGLIDAALELFPDARIGYAGVQRSEDTAEPLEYYTKFPHLDDARVLILEPMLATGGSLQWAASKVAEQGATDVTAVCVVAAPAGIEHMSRAHPDVRLVTAAVDRSLDENFYIRPGLGDMGDRLFGTE